MKTKKPYLIAALLVAAIACAFWFYRFASKNTQNRIESEYAKKYAEKSEKLRAKEGELQAQMANIDRQLIEVNREKKKFNDLRADYQRRINSLYANRSSNAGSGEIGGAACMGNGAGGFRLVSQQNQLDTGFHVIELGERGSVCAKKLNACQDIVLSDRGRLASGGSHDSAD